LPKCLESLLERLKKPGKNYTALKIFEDSNKKWPSYVTANADALAAFADTHFNLGNYDRSLELFVELVNLFPESDEGKNAVNMIGDIYMIKKMPLAAIKVYGAQAGEKPNDPFGLASRLRLAALGHSSEKLIDERKAVIFSYPDYFHPMKTYDDIIAKHPDTLHARDAMYQKAWLYNRRRQYIESVITLKDMMFMFPATKVLEPVHKLVQDNLFKMIRHQYGQKGYFAVINTYFENFDPFLVDVSEPDILLDVGEAYYEMGLYDRSLAKFIQAEQLDMAGRFRDRIRYYKGRAHASKGEYEKAIEMLAPFGDMLEGSELSPDALHLLGDIYNATGDAGNAVKTYMTAVSIEPEHERVSLTAYRTGLLFKSMGRHAQAATWFKMAITGYRPLVEQPDPYHVRESYYQLMEAYYRGGMYEQAIDFANHAVKRYPDSPHNRWALYIISDSEAMLSRDEEAVEMLKALAKDDGASIYGRVARASLDMTDWKLKHGELFDN